MYNVLLVCSSDMSTSLLVSKMEKSALEKWIEAKIEAIAEADEILLGPQVRYLLSKIKTIP